MATRVCKSRTRQWQSGYLMSLNDARFWCCFLLLYRKINAIRLGDLTLFDPQYLIWPPLSLAYSLIAPVECVAASSTTTQMMLDDNIRQYLLEEFISQCFLWSGSLNLLPLRRQLEYILLWIQSLKLLGSPASLTNRLARNSSPRCGDL